MQILTVPLSVIVPDPDQPRQSFPKTELNELKQSIEKQGILQPLIVESNYNGDKYLLLDGERRYRCSKELNLSEVPCYIIIGPLSSEERLLKRFSIQELHKNWSIFDKARAIYEFKKESKYTINVLSSKLNLHPSVVHHWLSFVDLSENMQSKMIELNVPYTHLIYIVRIIKNYNILSEFSLIEIEQFFIDKFLKYGYNAEKLKTISNILSSKEQLSLKIKFLTDINYTLDVFLKEVNKGKNILINSTFKKLVDLDINLTKIFNDSSIQLNDEQNNMLKILSDKLNIHFNKQ